MSQFVFHIPYMLAALLFVPVVYFLLHRARQKRREILNAMGSPISTHRRLRDALRIGALSLLVLALARPGFSPQAESNSRTGRDVVFALDVSRSMLAEDVVPSRLESAKQAIRDALADFGNERVGLVIYAGSASILCPLTYDYDFVRFMLDQATPRSVDFGGTTLQAAVEKSVDQMFLEGREDLQDLIVLTDGGDHDSQMDAVVALIEDSQVDCLVIGIGDVNAGATIPVVGSDGSIIPLESEGAVVYTKLEDASLQEFAQSSSRASYISAGSRPFNLSQLYADHASNKPTAANISEIGTVIYQEAGPFFIIPAIFLLIIAECWGRQGLQLGAASALVLTFSSPSDLKAADGSFTSQFNEAVAQMETGDYATAAELLSAIYQNAGEQNAKPAELAAVQMNRGLSYLKLSKADAEQSPETALIWAESAQQAFLSAKRYSPDSSRASIRLTGTSQWIETLKLELTEQAEKEAEIEEAINQIVEILEVLLKDQTDLRRENNNNDINRTQPKRRKRNEPPPPQIVAPEHAPEMSIAHSKQQVKLSSRGAEIVEIMHMLDKRLAAQSGEELSQFQSILNEPIGLMNQATDAQKKAAELLQAWSSWAVGRNFQGKAIEKIEATLALLRGNSQAESEDSEDFEEDEEDYDSEEHSESMSSSEMTEGDFASDAGMQKLPVPNYSADEILMEELGNMQFRQQKRANAQAGKVKKDY